MPDPLSAYEPPAPVAPPPPKPGVRPTSITVFGILNLVFAVMGFFGTCIGMVPMFLLPKLSTSMELPPNPVFDVMQESRAYFGFMVVSMCLGMIAAIVLGVAGMGLLKMRSWGRKLSIGYGVYAIFAVIAGTIANFVWLVEPLMEQAGRPGAGPEAAGAIGGMIGGTVGSCFGLIYPVCLLIFLFRPNVVQALRSPS